MLLLNQQERHSLALAQYIHTQWISKCHSALWRRMNFVDVTTSVTVNSAPRLVRSRAAIVQHSCGHGPLCGSTQLYDGIVAKDFLPSINEDTDIVDFNAETPRKYTYYAKRYIFQSCSEIVGFLRASNTLRKLKAYQEKNTPDHFFLPDWQPPLIFVWFISNFL